MFGDLTWLSAFQSDAYRLAAIFLVCFTLVAIFCLPKLVEAWRKDRRDRRAHERRTAELAAAIDDKLARRKAERLDLDA